MLALQVWVHYLTPPAKALATDLPTLPSVAMLRVVSLDEPIALSKMLMLYLQAFDNQPGVSIPRPTWPASTPVDSCVTPFGLTLRQAQGERRWGCQHLMKDQ